MNKNTSRKHHYLPRHYLKGFTDDRNRFYVYDKQKDKIFYTSPDTTFFQNNLNTVTLPNGSSSDFLEELYTDLENRCWRSFDMIRKSTFKNPVSLLDKMHLFLFLLFLYWRLPNNIEFAEKLSQKAFLDNNEFDYFRLVNKSGENAPKGIAEIIKKSSAFKRSFRQIIPFVPLFKDQDWAVKLENWRFLYTEKSWSMVGDNPIIVKGGNVHDFVNCLEEFVFPISGKILLVSINNPLNKGLPPEFTVQLNTAIIEKAQRFAACNNKDFLEALIKHYKFYIQYGKTNAIIPDMFEMLEQ